MIERFDSPSQRAHAPEAHQYAPDPHIREPRTLSLSPSAFRTGGRRSSHGVHHAAAGPHRGGVHRRLLDWLRGGCVRWLPCVAWWWGRWVPAARGTRRPGEYARWRRNETSRPAGVRTPGGFSATSSGGAFPQRCHTRRHVLPCGPPATFSFFQFFFLQCSAQWRAVASPSDNYFFVGGWCTFSHWNG